MFNILNQFFRKYTYRQRFIFFALIFFFIIPYPSYWLWTTQSFLIGRNARSIIGTANMENLVAVLTKAIQYQLFFSSTKISKNRKQEELIHFYDEVEQHLRNLAKLQMTQSWPKAKTLGYGFSNPPDLKIDTKKLIDAWSKIPKSDSDVGAMTSQQEVGNAIDTFINMVFSYIYKFGYQSDLSLRSEQTIQRMTIAAFYHLPKLMQQIGKLLLAEEDLHQNNPGIAAEVHNVRTVFLQLIENDVETNKIESEEVFKSARKNFKNNKTLYAALSNLQSELPQINEEIRNLLSFIKTTGQENHPTQEENLSLFAASRTIDNIENYITQNLLFINKWLSFRGDELLRYHFYSIALQVLTVLLVIIAIFLRVLTRHLTRIFGHINALAQGDFSQYPYPNINDEFVQIGKAFNKVAQSIQKILSKTQEIGSLLTDSIVSSANAIEKHKKIVLIQETKSVNTAKIAVQMAENCRTLANTMNDLTLRSQENMPSKATKDSLESMRDSVKQTGQESYKITSTFAYIDMHVNKSVEHINMMKMISDNANLLSLNSSINTANTPQEHRQSFWKITREIQRFASQTAHSTHNIHRVIQEVYTSGSLASSNVDYCIHQIVSGINRLQNTSMQLHEITNQVDYQIAIYNKVNRELQKQATEAENNIKFIGELTQTAHENSSTINLLHEKLDALQQAAEELKHLFHDLIPSEKKKDPDYNVIDEKLV